MIDPLLQRPRIVQRLWLLVTAATVPLYVIPIAVQWSKLRSTCAAVSSCAGFQLDEASARILAQHGVSIVAYAAFTLAVVIVAAAGWFLIAGLIIGRKPDDRGAVVAAFFLALFPVGEASVWISSSGGIFLGGIAIGATLLFALLFPNGRFVPSRTRWAGLAVLPAMVLAILPISAVFSIPVIAIAIVAVWAQIYRYRRVSSWAERQQTKWGVFGLLVGTVGFIVIIFSFALLPSSFDQNGTIYAALMTSVLVIVVSTIPASIGVAMLRSRLWDVDQVITRSLAYLLLTVSLVAIYAGSVIGLQAIFRALTGQQSDIAIAVSTLAIAALFNPLRRRFQILISHTFYRRRYDAAQVLSAFSAACRDETDLEHLRQGLTQVIHDTIQPGHVSLWLRDVP